VLLLVTDTSGKQGSVALVRAGGSLETNRVEAIGAASLSGGAFSAQLVPQIAGLLTQHGLSKNDIGAFVVVSGPGSFTGLRVGLAAIKALAEVLRKPIVAVSLLEVLAWQAVYATDVLRGSADSKTFPFLIALDAGRGQAFVGEFHVDSSDSGSWTLSRKQESLLTLPELTELKRTESLLRLASPDALVLDYLNANLQSPNHSGVYSVRPPDSAAVGWLGWKKLQAGESVSPEELEANYMRRSDAEMFVKSGS
jgi:tRNA threonylcarbamoyladenosine biosynthesis protein TsaB